MVARTGYLAHLIGRVTAGVALLLFSFNLVAHQTSESYLSLRVDGANVTGTLDLALIDLEHAVHLDADGNGAITYDELKAKQGEVDAYVLKHLQIHRDREPGGIHITDHQVASHSDGIYDVIEFTVNGANEPKSLEVEYRLFLEFNPLQRGLMQLDFRGQQRVIVFTADASSQRFTLAEPSPGEQFRNFVKEGVRHIWQGYDHILFLLALLFPAVLHFSEGRWQPVAQFRPAFLQVLKVITAFTAAHSITLSLAALEVLKLPPRLVESAIAASVVLAAANNLLPLVRERVWTVAFGFGLIHGFGFANVLRDLGLARGQLAVPLVSFNVGVEIGQLAIVAAFLPIAFAVRKTRFYRGPVFRAGSALILLIATIWMAERIFEFKALPF